MEETINPQAYVLVQGVMDGKGTITDKIVGITFNIYDAEKHRDSGVENDFKGPFPVNADWMADAETSALCEAMRGFRSMVKVMQEEALR
jgi:hypothetical protein